MAAVSNKKGVVGSKGRNMPIMPSMSEVVPTMVYSIFIGANIDQKTKKYSVLFIFCLLYTSPSPRDYAASRMPSSA